MFKYNYFVNFFYYTHNLGKSRYYFTFSPECFRILYVTFSYYLMHPEKVFFITFPSQTHSF